MTPEEQAKFLAESEMYATRAAERARRRAENVGTPIWFWLRPLTELDAVCRSCKRRKYRAAAYSVSIYGHLMGEISICSYCDADPAHPPRLGDVR